MFSVNIFRRFRPCVVSESFRYIHITGARQGAPLPASCFKTVGGKQLYAVGRSFLNINNKVQSHCPSPCFLSALAHSEDGNLIYTGSLGSAVRGVKMFSYSTSGASLFLMPQILLKTGVGVQSFALQTAFCGVIGFFTFLTPVVLHLITKGYVIRLYHHPDRDTYTAVTYSVFLTEKKSVFHQSQVKIPAVSKMFTTFYVNNMGLLVNPDLFTLPHDYNHLMGYDKPFSFDTDDMDSPNKS
ncbi:transmembrane protein 70, mitochondrial [Seriola lalandi dorsalis]|uniref:Transmembrane protein 70 n=1 Tax=Seriola lalandi dorsalis TaxID=1841481 RepID=A0A3B4XCU0_SERLL|nr:transmembrane protein 70, mitochondrial [Seriola lalandi dorsalis]XP_056246923.1 transmembrane protein 70, mitochondrial [Seriola aureovittata]